MKSFAKGQTIFEETVAHPVVPVNLLQTSPRGARRLLSTTPLDQPNHPLSETLPLPTRKVTLHPPFNQTASHSAVCPSTLPHPTIQTPADASFSTLSIPPTLPRPLPETHFPASFRSDLDSIQKPLPRTPSFRTLRHRSNTAPGIAASSTAATLLQPRSTQKLMGGRSSKNITPEALARARTPTHAGAFEGSGHG